MVLGKSDVCTLTMMMPFYFSTGSSKKLEQIFQTFHEKLTQETQTLRVIRRLILSTCTDLTE